MSVAAGGGGTSAVDPKKTLALGIVGGLVGIYLVPFVPTIGPLFGALGAVCAIIWGADAIARVASYGLGTGVPSIGYMSLAIGVIGAIAGMAGAIIFGSGLNVLIGPIFGIILAMIVGAVVALVGKKVLKMKIPILVRCTVELSGAAAISIIGFSAAIAGGIGLPAILTTVISTGFIGLLFILNTMAIQHPFNACLGPQEDRTRTLKLAASTGFIAMAIVGILGIGVSSVWWVISIIGAIAWFISISAFIQDSTQAAASVKWSGWWPKEEEL
ncbi:MAG: tetrahydromethanopterin S-methyltransferase subunit C [Methanobacterium sp.]|jgi:tetrahydromethanopterin S-methyltransferase subunit C|nr:tetrahydromethanopterin S-methyltransferase subunit C [Methanobacterium sp.]